MKMVIGQLEGILRELKEVAKELREVSERPAGTTQTLTLPGWAQHQNVYACLSVQCYVHLGCSAEDHPFLSPCLKSALLKIHGGAWCGRDCLSRCHWAQPHQLSLRVSNED